MSSSVAKVCIICRKIKNDFNKEHVIPATLGGDFMIDLVCSDCNKLLGDRIDTPFTNHKQILLYRHQFSLSRQDRDIKNPFSGVFKDSEGNAYIVAKGDEKFTGEYLPQFTITESEHGLMGMVNVSAKLLDANPEFLEKYKRKFKAETGFDVNYHTKEKFLPGKALVAETSDSDNKIILGCLKMVYEFSVACIPEYFEDNIAIAYSNMLIKGTINHDFADYIVPKFSLHPFLEMNLEKFPELKEYHVVVMIEVIEGLGLVAFVKLFEKYLPFILSEREDYLDERILLLLNDSVNEKARTTFLKEPYSISLNFGDLPIADNPVIDPKEPIRFYNSAGTISFVIDEKSTVPVYRNLDYRVIAKGNRIEEGLEGLFVKCAVTGEFYSVKWVIFNFK